MSSYPNENNFKKSSKISLENNKKKYEHLTDVLSKNKNYIVMGIYLSYLGIKSLENITLAVELLPSGVPPLPFQTIVLLSFLGFLGIFLTALIIGFIFYKSKINIIIVLDCGKINWDDKPLQINKEEFEIYFFGEDYKESEHWGRLCEICHKDLNSEQNIARVPMISKNYHKDCLIIHFQYSNVKKNLIKKCPETSQFLNREILLKKKSHSKTFPKSKIGLTAKVRPRITSPRTKANNFNKEFNSADNYKIIGKGVNKRRRSRFSITGRNHNVGIMKFAKMHIRPRRISMGLNNLEQNNILIKPTPLRRIDDRGNAGKILPILMENSEKDKDSSSDLDISNQSSDKSQWDIYNPNYNEESIKDQKELSSKENSINPSNSNFKVPADQTNAMSLNFFKSPDEIVKKKIKEELMNKKYTLNNAQSLDMFSQNIAISRRAKRFNKRFNKDKFAKSGSDFNTPLDLVERSRTPKYNYEKGTKNISTVGLRSIFDDREYAASSRKRK